MEDGPESRRSDFAAFVVTETTKVKSRREDVLLRC